jgi:hypothetical protein
MRETVIFTFYYNDRMWICGDVQGKSHKIEKKGIYDA